MRDTLLLFDYMSLFYRGYHVNSGLQFAGHDTGALYGMVVQVVSTINQCSPTELIIARDSKPYLRQKDYPEYKSGRKSRDMDKAEALKIKKSMELCDAFLQLLGIPSIEVKGLEADDIIGALVKYKAVTFGKVIAATSDSDLYQLFTFPNFYIYKGSVKGTYSREDFLTEYGIDPMHWTEVVAMTGGHNSLSKIPGIGEKTAIKIVTDNVFRETKKALLKSYKDLVQLNIRLAEVPYYRFRNWYTLEPDEVPIYNERKLMSFLQKYGIQYTAGLKKACETIHGIGKYGTDNRSTPRKPIDATMF